VTTTVERGRARRLSAPPPPPDASRRWGPPDDASARDRLPASRAVTFPLSRPWPISRAESSSAGEVYTVVGVTVRASPVRPRVRRRARPRGLRRLAARQAGHRAGCGVQARQRRHRRLPGAQRRRPAAAAGRRRPGHRPRRCRNSRLALGRRSTTPRRRSRPPSAPKKSSCSPRGSSTGSSTAVACGKVVAQKPVLGGGNAPTVTPGPPPAGPTAPSAAAPAHRRRPGPVVEPWPDVRPGSTRWSRIPQDNVHRAPHGRAQGRLRTPDGSSSLPTDSIGTGTPHYYPDRPQEDGQVESE
jgi:hypothetical protein